MQKKHTPPDHVASCSFFDSFSLVFCKNIGSSGNAYGYVPRSFASTAEGGGHFVILRVNSETLLPHLIRKTCSPVNLLRVLSSVYGIILHKNKIKTTKQKCQVCLKEVSQSNSYLSFSCLNLPVLIYQLMQIPRRVNQSKSQSFIRHRSVYLDK